jgi:hypothetical protein
MPLLITPGIPFFVAAVAGAILAALGLLLIDRQHIITVGLRLAPSSADLSRRFIVGNLAGVPIASAVVLIVIAGNIQGATRLLLLGSAIAAYLSLALVIPRRPFVQREREAARLRMLTPGFISFVAYLSVQQVGSDVWYRVRVLTVKETCDPQRSVVGAEG